MRKVVVILGMHRSGTSALAGALAQMGVDFGKHLISPSRHNPKGYFEHPEIVALHDELLCALGSRWDDYLPLPSSWTETEVAREIRSSVLGILKRDFGEASLFGVKDPRLCRLMPLWFPIFETLPAEPHFVLTIRHPWEVAESLRKREDLEPSKSFLLWLEHTLQAESFSHGYKRAFVPFNEVLDDPLAVMARLQRDFELPVHPWRIRAALHTFLKPSLRHHRLAQTEEHGKKAGADIPSLATEVYEVVKEGDNSTQFAAKLGELTQQFVSGRKLFHSRLKLLETELANLDKRIGEIEQVTARLEKTVRLEVFHPVAEGYRAAESQARYFNSGSWERLIIDLPAWKEESTWPLRIDPLTCPAVIEIAEIALKDPVNDKILWSASAQEEFETCEICGTAARLPYDKHLRILSFGGDPQLLLPLSTAELHALSLRLEISLVVNPGADAIREFLAMLNGTTLLRT